MRVAAVVVTYNRLNLLKENLKSLLYQSIPCDIILINNASTDGTEEYILEINESRIKYFNTGKNLGGAGGFAKGIEIGEKEGYDYLWVMDDDAVPEANALESLVYKATSLKNDFSFLASTVYWTNGKLFPMNIPDIKDDINKENVVCFIKKYKLIPIKSASFVGCFVNTNFSIDCGLPISEFFIYGDDVEYTSRLRKKNKAFLDLDSVIVHKAPSIAGADIANASNDRIERFYFQSRNGMYISKKKSIFSVLNRFIKVFKKTKEIIQSDANKKIRRIFVLYKGTIMGLLFNPRIKYSR